ncbi:type 1 secretion C-target domain protein, partial [Vibrio parahaemolyticus V-223/04]
WCKHH